MKSCIIGLAVLALLGPVGNASAGAIAIANHSFEDPTLPEATWNRTMQDWTYGGGSSIGTWRPGADTFDLSTLDGLQNGYLVGGQIAQQLTTGLVLGETYHLSALFATVSTSGYSSGGSLELWAGGTVAGGNVTGGTLLGALIVNDADLVNGEFLLFQTDIVAPTSGPLGGALLSVRFVSNGAESEIDNVQLGTTDGTVPEPSAWALLGLGMTGLIGVFGRGRGRRAKRGRSEYC